MRLRELFPDGLYGLIYDCDGVMINSAEGNRQLYNRVLARLDVDPMTPEQEKFAFQATFQQALAALVPPEKHHLIEDAYKAAIDYDRDVLPRIKLMPGYREFVQGAHTRGLAQAIDTNRTDFGIEKILTHFELPPWFNPVITSSTVERPKPFPDGVEMICSAWGCAPDRTLFIGDSPDDRAAARSAGARFAAFGDSGLAGDISISDWASLAKLLWQADLT